MTILSTASAVLAMQPSSDQSLVTVIGEVSIGGDHHV